MQSEGHMHWSAPELNHWKIKQTTLVIWLQCNDLLGNPGSWHSCEYYFYAYYPLKHCFINNIQKCCWVLWAWAHLRWTEAKWKGMLGSEESTLQMVFQNCLKSKKTIQIVTSTKLTIQHLWQYGSVLQPITWVTCTSRKAPLLLNGTYRFWSNICYHPF